MTGSVECSEQCVCVCVEGVWVGGKCDVYADEAFNFVMSKSAKNLNFLFIGDLP